jgi:predicted dehydrogenase
MAKQNSVIIGTPEFLHSEHFEAASQAQKHSYIEKRQCCQHFAE